MDGSYDIVAGPATAKARRVEEPAKAIPAAARGTAAPAPARERPAARPAPAPRPVPAPPPPATATKKLGALVGGAVVTLLVIVGTVAVYKQFFGTVPATAQIVANAVPYGKVMYLESVDGKQRINVEKETPAVIMVPPGEYKIFVQDPEGKMHEGHVKASNEDPGIYNDVFTAIDVKSIVNSY